MLNHYAQYKFGDCYYLRELDYFPSKLGEYGEKYDWNIEKTITEGSMHVFSRPEDAASAYLMLCRLFELTHDKDMNEWIKYQNENKDEYKEKYKKYSN